MMHPAEAKEALQKLKGEAEACKRCELHKTRTHVVFGTGSADTSVVLVGEAPGFYEDKQGLPFVGAAGKNLDALLHQAGLRREAVYICNVLKCRPPGNRDPTPDEIEACKRFLEGQLSTIKPKLVVALGRIAASTLLGRPVTMGREHGAVVNCSFAGLRFKLFLTYHPAAGIYSGQTKLELQADFKRLGGIISKLKLT